MASALYLDRPFFGSRRMAVTLGVGHNTGLSPNCAILKTDVHTKTIFQVQGKLKTGTQFRKICRLLG